MLRPFRKSSGTPRMRRRVDPYDSQEMKQRAKSQEAPMIDRESSGAWPLHRYSVVDGGDIVGIMQRNGEMVRIPAWTVIGDHLILGAHPADTMPPSVDAIANVDSFRFYDVPDGVLYLHFAYRDANVIPDSTDLRIAASFLNDLRCGQDRLHPLPPRPEPLSSPDPTGVDRRGLPGEGCDRDDAEPPQPVCPREQDF
jgi:hypothetical protein